MSNEKVYDLNTDVEALGHVVTQYIAAWRSGDTAATIDRYGDAVRSLPGGATWIMAWDTVKRRAEWRELAAQSQRSWLEAYVKAAHEPGAKAFDTQVTDGPRCTASYPDSRCAWPAGHSLRAELNFAGKLTGAKIRHSFVPVSDEPIERLAHLVWRYHHGCAASLSTAELDARLRDIEQARGGQRWSDLYGNRDGYRAWMGLSLQECETAISDCVAWAAALDAAQNAEEGRTVNEAAERAFTPAEIHARELVELADAFVAAPSAGLVARLNHAVGGSGWCRVHQGGTEWWKAMPDDERMAAALAFVEEERAKRLERDPLTRKRETERLVEELGRDLAANAGRGLRPAPEAPTQKVRLIISNEALKTLGAQMAAAAAPLVEAVNRMADNVKINGEMAQALADRVEPAPVKQKSSQAVRDAALALIDYFDHADSRARTAAEEWGNVMTCVGNGGMHTDVTEFIEQVANPDAWLRQTAEGRAQVETILAGSFAGEVAQLSALASISRMFDAMGVE